MSQIQSKLSNQKQNGLGLSKNKVKYYTILLIPIIATLLAISIYSFVQYKLIRYFLAEGIVAIIFTCFLILGLIINYIMRSKILSATYCKIQLIYVLLICASGLCTLGLMIDIIIVSTSIQSLKMSYGPLAFIYNNGTRIHWYTTKLTRTELYTGVQHTNQQLTNYHEVFVEQNKFNYQFKGINPYQTNYIHCTTYKAPYFAILPGFVAPNHCLNYFHPRTENVQINNKLT
ncbi:Hypothetical_protein [Hexamita inflata]|uniref:Hypothetical_protein n=1 Tax=Hexamita inflata TaxID=28002 RepID=A0AA86N7C7_9EUKA|nr:Hypothetical protein HINF_LOCUS1882 [Hexamita inflata]